jgi:epoxyqueuosine reductase
LSPAPEGALEASQGVEWFMPEGEPLPEEERTPPRLSQLIESAGLELGFARVGIASPEPLELARARLEQFRASGHAATMEYLKSGDRHDPRALLPGVKSVVVTAFAHGDPELVPLRLHRDGPAGRVARYARGEDYHLVLKARLLDLGRRIATLVGQPLRGRACVDTAPLLERELAVRAGLGFQGKSTLLITPGVGSYVLLSELLLELPLEPSPPSAGSCGSCRACLDACPTAAFAAPYQLDARRCISYLTIEHEGVIPLEFRAPIGNRVFGCDVCQETCPYNASPSRTATSRLGRRDALEEPDLVTLLELGAAGYRRLVKRTALRRTSRTTLQRNAAIALGNSGSASAVAPLARALRTNARSVVRLHAAWALGQLSAHLDDDARLVLSAAAARDDDVAVREEARSALARARTPLPQGVESTDGSSAR